MTDMAATEVFDIEIPDGGTVHGPDHHSDDDSIEIDDVVSVCVTTFVVLSNTCFLSVSQLLMTHII